MYCWILNHSYCFFSSVQFSRSVMSESLRPHESRHARPLCPSPTPRVYSNSRAWSRWCHPAISSSVVSFSSCPQSLLASGSFPVSQIFAWGGQSIGVSALASVLPMNTQDLISFRIDWLDLLAVQGTIKSLQHHSSKASILWRSAFFTVQLSHPYMTTGKTIALTRQIIEKAREFQKNIYFCFIDYVKAFDCVDHNKLWEILKEMGIPPDLPLEKSVYRSGSKLEQDMEQQTGSK